MPYRGTVGSDIDSHYMFTGLNAGEEYLFSKMATSTGDYLYIYNDIGYTDRVCYPDYTQSRDEYCVGTPSGNTVYIQVKNTGYMTRPGYFTLDYAAVPHAEGSGLTPIGIVGASHSGSVNTSVSFYQLSLAPDTTYNISLTGVSGDPDLYVFNNAAMSGEAQCHSIQGKGQDESCQATSNSDGALWVVVDGSLSQGGGSYLLVAN
jgi:hypothetical protein